MLRKLKKSLKKAQSRLSAIRLPRLRLSKNQAVGTMVGLAIVAISLNLELGADPYFRPHTPLEYSKTSVKIVNLMENSGGSGVILESHDSESLILTNRHVCEVVAKGGYVIQGETKHFIAEIKKARSHDLCLVKVNENLHMNTKVASKAPSDHSDANVSGHPKLLPHVYSKGHFSGRIVVTLQVGIRECTDEEYRYYGPLCLAGVAVLENYDSQLVTGTIMSGSSGSAVFDENGEIAGLVFAGFPNQLSYAFIVPQEYVYKFVNEEARLLEWQSVNY